MLEAKHTFEAYCRQHGCQVQHYHCNNDRFADSGWMAGAAQKGQTISFCGVNAHHQNGLAEKAMRDLQEQARKAYSMQRLGDHRLFILCYGIVLYI